MSLEERVKQLEDICERQNLIIQKMKKSFEDMIEEYSNHHKLLFETVINLEDKMTEHEQLLYFTTTTTTEPPNQPPV